MDGVGVLESPEKDGNVLMDWGLPGEAEMQQEGKL